MTHGMKKTHACDDDDDDARQPGNDHADGIHILGKYTSHARTQTGAMMSVDDSLMCSFQILKPADKRRYVYGANYTGRPITPPRGANNKSKKK